MPSLTLDRLTRKHRTKGAERVALADLTLTVEDGELLALVGPSGSGKTTALRLIAGLDQPDSGRVLIGGRDVTELAPRDRDVALVFQDLALYPHLTAYGNIAFPLQMRRQNRAEVDRCVREAAALVGIESLLDRRPGSLSGGEQQRVALARAIVRKPSVFLLDEPLSSLDPQRRGELRSEIKALQRRLRVTLVYVTHDQEEAMVLGDRIAVIRAGALQQCAPPMDAYNRPENGFVARFVGSPPMNMVNGTMTREEGTRILVTSPIGTFRAHLDAAWTECVSGKEATLVTVGVRPEDIVVTEDDGSDATMNDQSRPCQVQRIEFLGASTEYELRIDEKVRVVARVPSTHGSWRANRCRFRILEQRAHLFERTGSERRIPARVDLRA